MVDADVGDLLRAVAREVSRSRAGDHALARARERRLVPATRSRRTTSTCSGVRPSIATSTPRTPVRPGSAANPSGTSDCRATSSSGAGAALVVSVVVGVDPAESLSSPQPAPSSASARTSIRGAARRITVMMTTVAVGRDVVSNRSDRRRREDAEVVKFVELLGARRRARRGRRGAELSRVFGPHSDHTRARIFVSDGVGRCRGTSRNVAPERRNPRKGEGFVSRQVAVCRGTSGGVGGALRGSSPLIRIAQPLGPRRAGEVETGHNPAPV